MGITRRQPRLSIGQLRQGQTRTRLQSAGGQSQGFVVVTRGSRKRRQRSLSIGHSWRKREGPSEGCPGQVRHPERPLGDAEEIVSDGGLRIGLNRLLKSGHRFLMLTLCDQYPAV